jgi:hypothetical protein
MAGMDVSEAKERSRWKMALATMAEYKELMTERPRKLTTEQVNYRRADGDMICAKCFHFYERRIDDRGTCELFRSPETDEDGVKPYFTCDFFSPDGEEFPLYPQTK